MNPQNIQNQYDEIYFYFKTTCEPFDFLEWDGDNLHVWKNEIVIERYVLKDLKSLIFGEG